MLTMLYTRLTTPTGLMIVLALILTLWQPADGAKVRIKDITALQNTQEVDLVGYGLIIGLDGTGDGTGTQFTVRSLTNMMERMGLTVDARKVKVKNVAAVMVTGRISGHQAEGSYFDVTVSSVGDASSLQGGTLILTPLAGADGTMYAMAQGPVSIGGFNVQVDDGNKIVNNYTLVGRVPGGGKITKGVETRPELRQEFFLSLHNPDFTTSSRIAERINIKYGLTSIATDAGRVKVRVPDSLSYPELRARFMSGQGKGAGLIVLPGATRPVHVRHRPASGCSGQHRPRRDQRENRHYRGRATCHYRAGGHCPRHHHRQYRIYAGDLSARSFQ
jgi:flagellar P-ring protein precursor FlgI